MKPLLLSLILALILTGCGQGDAGSSKDDKKQDKSAEKKPELPPGTIRIANDVQTMAGIRVAQVEVRSVSETLGVAGQIVANEQRTVHIGTYTSGRFTEINANIGDVVKRGAVLARMHSHEVHETLAAYQTAKQDVGRQRSALEFGERARDRMRRLYELKSASLQEVERSETDVRSLQVNLANARIALERETAHFSDILNVKPSALDHVDETTEQVPVISPASGIVTARMVTAGAVVEPGQEVYTVTDLSTVWMIASVNESDIRKVKLGDRATVTVQAFPDQRFAAIVTNVNAELDPKTRTLPVRLVVPNADLKLRLGMYANAQLTQAKVRSAMFLPEEAIQDMNGGSVVFVRQSGNEFSARPVQISQRMNGQAEITGGLKPGEVVIVKGSFVAKSEMLKSQIGE